MKTGFLCTLSVTLAALFITASQIIPAHAGPKSVSSEHRLSIAEPQSSGQWKGYDLAVDYNYSKEQGQMSLSGNIQFANYLVMGYSRLDEFRLGVIFLDENGRVLQQVSLLTNRGSLDPIPFNRKINLPANAAFMAFSYQGKVISSGGMGAGPSSFMFSPIR